MKISVVTIAYNQAEYLEAALRSVLDQDYAHIEYIVVDPGSTDDSRDIIQRYADRITKIVFEPDAGPADGLNKGFSHATGDIFFYINADDIVLPGAFRTIAKHFDQHPDIDIIYGHGMQLDAAGRAVRRLYSTRWGLRAYGYGACNVSQQATYFRSSIFRAVGGFNPKNCTCWDGELLVDMALARGSFLRVPEFLGGFRVHQDSITGSNRLYAEYPQDTARIAEKIFGRPVRRFDALWRILYRGTKSLRHPTIMADKLVVRRIRSQCLSLPDSLTGRIVWVGSYPAHYVRAFHRKIESVFPRRLTFVYVTNQRAESERSYEEGGLPSDSVLVPLHSISGILKLMHRLNPSALIIAGHFPRALVFAAMWGFARRRPVLYWSDTNLMDIMRRGVLYAAVRRIALRPLLRSMFMLLYIGSRNKEFYYWVCGHGLAPEKLQFLPCPHDGTSFELRSTRKRSFDSVCEFLYLGRLVPDKCVSRLIEAFAKLTADARAKARLTIAGDGKERASLEELVQKLGLAEYVRFIGLVASSKTADIMSQADAFVLPSYYESWGLVVNEALSASLPVIVPSWVGAASDLIVTGETGIQTKDNSPEALKEAMQKLIDNPKLRYELGQNGRELVRVRGFDINGAELAFAKILKALEVAES
jgi:glycosyltransferase involved in cell wall biosynthesis